MYRVPVYRIALVREGTLASAVMAIHGAAEAAAVLREHLSGADREHFVILCLDVKNRVRAINTVSVGTVHEALVHPREVFKPAILANSAGVIVGHNHTSGDPEPSVEDRQTTMRLSQAGGILGIPVLDHIIVTNERFMSFRERGWLP